MRHLVPLALLLVAAPATAFGDGIVAWSEGALAPPAPPVAASASARASPAAPAPAAPAGAVEAGRVPVAAGVDAAAAGARGPGASVSVATPEGLPVPAVRVEVEARAAGWLREAAAWRAARAADAPGGEAPAAGAVLSAAGAPEAPPPPEARRHAQRAPASGGLPEGADPAPSPAPRGAGAARAHAPGERAPPPGAVAAAAAGAILALLLLPVALHHRLRGARVLAQETRARAHALLAARPGASLAQVAAALEVDPKTAAYHVRRLAKEGLVVAEGPPRARRFFVAGALAPDARRRLLAERASPRVLAAVRGAPGLTKGALALRLGLARGTLAWHLARLAREGLVRVERAGREARVHPAPVEAPPGDLKPFNSQAR